MSTSFILKQPYRSSESKDREKAKAENARIRKQIKLRREKGKPLGSLLNPNETSIYLVFILDRNKIVKLKTGERIKPEYWDFKKQIVKSYYPGADELNTRLKNLKDKVDQTHTKIRNRYPGVDWDLLRSNLITLVKEDHAPILSKFNMSFFDVFDEYIKIKSKDLQILTIRKYNTLKKSLIDFQKTTNDVVCFDSIDLNFYDQYKHFLLTKKNPKKDETTLRNDTIAKYISNLKNFLKWSYERGFHKNDIFTNSDFTAKRKLKHEIITLSKEELNLFYSHNFSDKPNLERVRDLFCFAAFTGQRWSDVANFHKMQLHGTVWIFNSMKTKKDIRVPLIGFAYPALEILKKYNYELPKISGQKFNENIKKAGKEIEEFAKPVEIKRQYGAKEKTISKPLYKFISSHMARRTCVTILLQENVPPTTVMKLTGHSDLRTLLKYENTSDEALVNELQRIDFPVKNLVAK